MLGAPLYCFCTENCCYMFAMQHERNLQMNMAPTLDHYSICENAIQAQMVILRK